VQTLAALPALFSAAPPLRTSRFERPASRARLRQLIAYQDGHAGRGPSHAVLYVKVESNAVRPADVAIAAFLQEAIPGRHYQSALQAGRGRLAQVPAVRQRARLREGLGPVCSLARR